MQEDSNTCLVEWCDKGRKRDKQYCPSHAHRFRRHGDPLGGPRYYYGRPAGERFWARVVKQDNGCWVRGEGRKRDGYSQFEVSSAPNKRTVLSHRYAWELTHGVVPSGELNHLCYTRNCVNPDHLEVVTRQENLNHGNEQRRQERQAYRVLGEWAARRGIALSDVLSKGVEWALVAAHP